MSVQSELDQKANELFHRIFEDEYEGLVRYTCAVLKARDQSIPVNGQAEDVVQEMFSLAWEHREEILQREQPKGWFYKTLQYKSMEFLKEENKWRKRLMRYKQFYVPPAEPHISLELELEGLVPKEDFDLLCKIYWEGYSYRELCPKLNLTKEALGAKVHRIKKKIREKLKE